MKKSKARKQLDKYIDICLDCDGIQTEEENCYNCPTFFKVMEVVQDIRRERTENGKNPCEYGG